MYDGFDDSGWSDAVQRPWNGTFTEDPFEDYYTELWDAQLIGLEGPGGSDAVLCRKKIGKTCFTSSTNTHD